MANNQNELETTIEIPFESNRIATVVFDVLRVDAEPKRSGVSKELSVKGNILIGTFKASTARQLRVSITSYFDKVHLVSETIQQFGNPVSESYSHY